MPPAHAAPPPAPSTVAVAPDALPLVWVGARTKVVDHLPAGATATLTLRALLPHPGVYDLNRFTVVVTPAELDSDATPPTAAGMVFDDTPVTFPGQCLVSVGRQGP